MASNLKEAMFEMESGREYIESDRQNWMLLARAITITRLDLEYLKIVLESGEVDLNRIIELLRSYYDYKTNALAISA